MENLVSDEVVAFGAVTTTSTGEAMVTMPIHNLITKGAMELRIIYRDSDPSLDHCPK